MRYLADGGCLPDTVHTDNKYNVKPRLYIQRSALADAFGKDFAEFLPCDRGIADLFFLQALPQLVNERIGGFRPDIRHYQQIAQLLVKIVVHLVIGGKEIVHRLQKHVARFFQPVFKFVEKAHLPVYSLIFSSSFAMFRRINSDIPFWRMVMPYIVSARSIVPRRCVIRMYWVLSLLRRT